MANRGDGIYVITYILYVYIIHVVCSVVSDSFCDPMDCSPPGSSLQGIFQVRIQECKLLLLFSR